MKKLAGVIAALALVGCGGESAEGACGLDDRAFELYVAMLIDGDRHDPVVESECPDRYEAALDLIASY